MQYIIFVRIGIIAPEALHPNDIFCYGSIEFCVLPDTLFYLAAYYPHD